MESVVRIERLTKVYEEGEKQRVVLDDLSVDFSTGQFTTVRGRSGSGKSTLLNLIAGIDEPTRGQVIIGGRSISQMSPRERAHYRRDSLGFVFQFFNLIPTLTVLENVSLPSELSGRSEAESHARAAQLLDQVGLGGREADFPDRLSGGEQQRVAIARALVEDPMLVLADEPTGNLDRVTGEVVLSMLEELIRERGLTLILATHSHRIARSADQKWALVDGKLEPDDETPF
ncbi:MAG: ABC transporter ATP-binding protein [Anaerolineales bacterium]